MTMLMMTMAPDQSGRGEVELRARDSADRAFGRRSIGPLTQTVSVGVWHWHLDECRRRRCLCRTTTEVYLTGENVNHSSLAVEIA